MEAGTDRLAEWGVVVFSMSVLSWVIWRLTGTLVKLVNPDRDYEVPESSNEFPDSS